MANEATVNAMKEWCVANYEKGADTMVECWGTSDYINLIDETCKGNEAAAWDTLKRVAAVYEDQQADARNSAW